ncbi:MAG: hypothetical protein II579_08805 [Treponema sp.]|nr:hypothetical protein [Treponema sp.]
MSEAFRDQAAELFFAENYEMILRENYFFPSAIFSEGKEEISIKAALKWYARRKILSSWGGLFGCAYRHRFRQNWRRRFISGIKGLSGLRLPTPENTTRQRRAGMCEYIKIFGCWQVLYQPAGKSGAQ